MENNFALENQLVIISTKTIHELLKYGSVGAEALALYNFYYYTAKWQKTNQPRATVSYCAKGLGWSERKIKKARQLLGELGLMTDITSKDKHGKINGWYVKLNYLWSQEKVDNLPIIEEKTTSAKNDLVDNRTPNALSDINLNALSDISKKSCSKYIERYNFLFKSNARVTDGRNSKLKARLKTFTYEEILTALENMAKIPWYTGKNDTKWVASPDFILRNDEQIDQFLNNVPKKSGLKYATVN